MTTKQRRDIAAWVRELIAQGKRDEAANLAALLHG